MSSHSALPSKHTPLPSKHSAQPSAAEAGRHRLPDGVAAIRAAAGRFARAELRSRTAGAISTPVPVGDRAIQAGHDAGLLRILVPTTFGGLGLGVLGAAIALEEVAAESAEAATLFAVSMLAQLPLVQWAAPQLQARFLPWFSGDEATLACGPSTGMWPGREPRTPYAGLPVPEALTARPVGEFLLVNGSLGSLVNAGRARFATVFVAHQPVAGAATLTCVVLPMRTPGVVVSRVTRRRDPLSLGAAVHFEDVSVPEENIIGRFGGGAALRAAGNDTARLFEAAISTGIARNAAGDHGDLSAAVAESRESYQQAAWLADGPDRARQTSGSSTTPDSTSTGLTGYEIARAGFRLDPGPLQR